MVLRMLKDGGGRLTCSVHCDLISSALAVPLSWISRDIAAEDILHLWEGRENGSGWLGER